MTRTGRITTLLATLLLGWAGAPALACTVERLAQVPITLAQGFPLVPIRIGGRLWPFLLDTGAQDWLVTPEAAVAIGLPLDPGRRTRVLGTSSTSEAPNVVLQGASLGGVALPARSVPAATLPGMETLDPVPAGIIGASALSGFDLLFDGPGWQLTLYGVDGCVAVPVPMEPPLSRTPLRRAAGGEMLLTVLLGGAKVEAVLDTGARGTVLSGAAAARIGGVRPGLRVGDDAVRDFLPVIAPLFLDTAEALLGMDYLGRRRAWISYATGQLIVQIPRSP